MKLWFLSLLLILSAAFGVAAVSGGAFFDPAARSVVFILPAETATDTLSAVPYACLQDMIQSEDSSQGTWAWRRLAQWHSSVCLFRHPAMTAPLKEAPQCFPAESCFHLLYAFFPVPL
ncbi:MAG: hypothetical protein J6M38_11500 [Lentisphaeria bacterium]|nr:hypothetical protein [Lentisphaeria bacterium]